MGDISEMRGLIVVGSFLAITVLLIAWMPGEFYTTGAERTIEVPEYFESSELVNWNFTYQIDISGDVYVKYWGKSEFGHDMMFTAQRMGIYMIRNNHGYTFLGFWTGGHRQEWKNKDGINRGDTLYANEIEADWDSEHGLASYTVKCKHFWMRADIAYNTTAYTSVKSAWDANDLHVMFGIQWDQRGSTWNSWSLISSILFFKLPNTNPYVNALIAIPLWIAIGYMAFIFILRTIGAVFGGGGA